MASTLAQAILLALLALVLAHIQAVALVLAQIQASILIVIIPAHIPPGVLALASAPIQLLASISAFS